MSSWPTRRSRSRTSPPPRRRGAARSSRPSTSTTSFPQENIPSLLSAPVPRGAARHHEPRLTTPDRHVLAIINFQALADLSTPSNLTLDNDDRLDMECRIHLDAIEEISLFTWCCHFDPQQISSVSIRNLCQLISTRVRETWDVRIPGHTLELRYSDYQGETSQLDDDLSIGETLEAWFPRWRTFQQTPFEPEPLLRWPRRPFVWRTSCHRKVPGVILP